jgi:hypothetical protein
VSSAARFEVRSPGFVCASVRPQDESHNKDSRPVPNREVNPAVPRRHPSTCHCVRFHQYSYSPHVDSQVVDGESDVHPPSRVSRLASHDGLTWLSVRRSRRPADRRRNLEQPRTGGLSTEPCQRVTTRAAPRRLSDLARKRAPVRRPPVVLLGRRVRGGVRGSDPFEHNHRDLSVRLQGVLVVVRPDLVRLAPEPLALVA